MSLKNSDSSFKLVATFAAIVFAIAFALLMFIGGYGFMASFFMSALIALLAAIILYLGLGNPAGQTEPLDGSASTGAAATAASGAAAAAGAAAVGASSGDDAAKAAEAEAAAAKKAAEEEGAKKAAADAEAARKAAEEEAARKAAAEADAAKKAAADAEAAKKAAEDEAARKAAEEEAARKAEETARKAALAEADAKRRAEAEAERARAEAEAKAAEEAEAARQSAEAATPAASASGTPDYDGDGILEGENEGTRPAGLDAPRGGNADDLKQIKGIGPKLEKLCNSLGFWHFDQVAGWSADEVAWVNANLQGFKGRVTRDNWVEQARILASGGETEFSKRVEDGDVY